VTTTDFTTGSYSTINLRDLTADVDLPSQVGIIESDNWAVYHNNRVYIINRFGFDNITVLDTADLTTAVAQFSTGNGTNPQDMAFVSDTKAYVSLLGSNDLLIVDLTAP
jgi:DNA-binding beta-propeller fold protein YncE